jgi:hypothetical protein
LKHPRSKLDDPADVELSNGPVPVPDETTPEEPLRPEPAPHESPLPDSPVLAPETPDPTPDPAPLHEPIPTVADNHHKPSVADLEQRVRRLEEAMALLQQGRPTSGSGAHNAVTASVPTAVPTPGHVTADRPEPPPAGPPPTATPTSTARRGAGWLFWEMFIEVRVFLRMFTDPRYSMSWFCRLLTPLLLAVLLFPGWIVPLGSLDILGVGWIAQKIGTLIAIYVLVKVLSHEARRYRQMAPDLPASMRL